MHITDPRVRFFYDRAGYSYDPKTETEWEGNLRCATLLANAEARAQRDGLRFEWKHDPDADHTGLDHTDPLWLCTVYDMDGTFRGFLMGNIDLGLDGTPGRVAYARVVEAELASEFYATTRA